MGNSPIQTGFLIGGFQISLLIIAGLFSGFGKSPYAFTPTHIMLNLFFVITFLSAIELSRSYLIKKGSKKQHLTFTIVIVTFILTIIQISPDKFYLLTMTNMAESLEFIGKTIITGVSIGFLASYLSYLGGASASISYIGTLTFFEWFSPLLPKPHWTITALIGTIAPAIGYIIIQNSSLTPKQLKREKKRKQSNGLSWTTAAIFCVIIIFFSFGYLGVKPTVISSGSMQPALHMGDIALVKKIDPTELQEGDVIQYVNQHNITIVHRLISIENKEGEPIFTTKGDANEEPDFPSIKKNRILGKNVFTIPKIGFIQIYVRDVFKGAKIPLY